MITVGYISLLTPIRSSKIDISTALFVFQLRNINMLISLLGIVWIILLIFRTGFWSVFVGVCASCMDCLDTNMMTQVIHFRLIVVINEILVWISTIGCCPSIWWVPNRTKCGSLIQLLVTTHLFYQYSFGLFICLELLDFY